MTTTADVRQRGLWLTTAGYFRATGEATRPRLSRREDLLTVTYSSWLIGGLFLDGWAHNNTKVESFFTPWHLVLYSGYAVTALWIFSRVLRHRAVPAGYGLGVIGVALFAVGGAGDLIWHSIFGVEVDLAALISPSHTTLFISALLFLTCPLRAAWSDPHSPRCASFAQLSPALVSVTLATATVAFFFQEFSPFLSTAATIAPDGSQLEGLAAVLISTTILLVPALLLLSRWLVPFGTFTVLFGLVCALMSPIKGFALGWTSLAGIVAGLAADVIVRRLRPTPSRPGTVRVFAATVTLVLWLAYFGLLAAFYSLGWTVELWGGSTAMAALTALGLTLLSAPPRTPAGVDGDDGASARAA